MTTQLLPELPVDALEVYLHYEFKVLDCKNGYMDLRRYQLPIARMTPEFKQFREAQADSRTKNQQKLKGRIAAESSTDEDP